MKYILCSGFGIDNNYWKNIIPLLDNDFVFLNELNRMADKNTDEDFIGLGHSLGFQKLHNSGIRFKGLIGLQSFLNFCNNDEKREKQLLAMLRILKSPKTEVRDFLKSFYLSCGYTEDIKFNFSREDLINDMIDMTKSYEHNGVSTLIIGTQDDGIVPRNVIEDNFRNAENVKIEFIPEGKHALGYLHSRRVFGIVKNWLSSI